MYDSILSIDSVCILPYLYLKKHYSTIDYLPSLTFKSNDICVSNYYIIVHNV
jgi:hypothetical protein